MISAGNPQGNLHVFCSDLNEEMQVQDTEQSNIMVKGKDSRHCVFTRSRSKSQDSEYRIEKKWQGKPAALEFQQKCEEN